MSIYSDKLAQLPIFCCTHKDTLARYLGGPSLDDVMSHNELTTQIILSSLDRTEMK